MTTEEKLFVQIFERKNSIIEQVRQQTEMYIQNLASKLLIDGITPPPWLWNPNSHSHSSDPKELNKEELISKILLQTSRNVAPYVSGQCSVYDTPVTTRDNAELTGRYCMDTHASRKKINGSISMLESRDNDVGCALNGVPDLDFSVNSPLDETDARISNVYSAPDQSLARIQRSRSRKKALELRTSAKAAAKSCLNHENGTGICYRENSLSRIDFPQDIGSSKSPKHYDVRGKNTGSQESNAGNCGKGFSISSYRNGITKSRSPCKETISVTQFHHGNAEVGIQLVDGHAEAQPLYLGSNFIVAPLIKDSDCLVLSPSSNSHIVVQPKQLVFDDMEDYIFSKNFSPSLKEERVNRSSGGYRSSYKLQLEEQMSMLEKTAERNDLAAVRSPEKSYDISPYQCSDDDEEEENEIPTTKFIPAWSRVDIALTLQKNLDPDVIFPRESFCSMDEVLQPRRRPVK